MRVRWTIDAADDLERIAQYIAAERPDTARRIALDIIQGVDALDTFPNRGRPFDSPRLTRISSKTLYQPCRPGRLNPK